MKNDWLARKAPRNLPLVEKHFDINVEWFDLRKTNKCMADFYQNPMEQRKAALRDARRGGSVPPMYMEQIRKAQSDGSLLCLVGNIECNEKKSDDTSKLVCVHHLPDREKNPGPDKVSPIRVRYIVVACGVIPDVEKANSLTAMIQSKWPAQIESGLPCVTQDLRWKEGLNLFVVGSMGALNIGPDAGNLMGIRRAAQIMANALGCRSWLRESVLANPFEAFNWSDSDSFAKRHNKNLLCYLIICTACFFSCLYYYASEPDQIKFMGCLKLYKNRYCLIVQNSIINRYQFAAQTLSKQLGHVDHSCKLQNPT